MRTSETVAAISPALVAALSEMEGIRKDATNPHFKKPYATLESVTEATRPVLAKHKLGILQGPGEAQGGTIALTTRIIHESGEWIESRIEIPMERPDPQKAGSAITYARRYALMAMLNVPAVDDDAEGAMTRNGGAPALTVAAPNRGPAPEGPDWWKCEGPGLSAYQAKKDGLDTAHERMREEIGKLSSATEWRQWCADNSDTIAKMPKAWRQLLRAEAEEMARELGVDFNQKRAA